MRTKFTNFLALGALPLMALGQTMVSTTPENKKVILEEFTGIYCVYCPQGHTIANQIMNNNPGNAFVINVHQGGFAVPSGNAPDFRTQFGDAIVNQSYSGSGFGYPSATVNRHVFPGYEMSSSGTTAMGRGYWANAANQILQQSSYVNLAANASVSVTDRIVTVNVEAYYTANSPVGTNKLNVALLQNNTKGPQTGGNQGNNYNHMHRLVHMLTGQWGEDITTTTQGSLVQKTYTFEVPGKFRNVFADISEFEVVVFMTETTQEVISGNKTMVEVIPSQYSNDLSVVEIKEIKPTCMETVNTKVTIMNVGNNNITSATINYKLNGGATQSIQWTGDLELLDYEEVDLALTGFNMEDVNTLEVWINDDENNSNNTRELTFNRAVQATQELTLVLNTDGYGSEASWNIKNSAGTTVANGSGYGNNQQYTIPITLDAADCYTFNLIDSYGDGGRTVTLKDSNDVTIYHTTGNYGSGESTNFSAGVMAVADNTLANVQIYPNPSTGIVNVDLKAAKNSIEVFDITGRKVKSEASVGAGTHTLNLSGLGKGTFVVKISDGTNTISKKVIIK
jgi:hypothetical protein